MFGCRLTSSKSSSPSERYFGLSWLRLFKPDAPSRVPIGKGEIEGRIAIVPVHHGIARAGVKAVAAVVPVDARESERVSDRRRVHDSIAAAQHHPRVDLIGEAEARAELSKIGILEGAPV